jgi:RimJ/RimL family protein N-acetyltransferase
MPDIIKNTYTLRPLEKADLASVALWFQDVGDLALFDRSSRVPYNLSSCEKHWDTTGNIETAGGKCWFAITAESTEVVGIVGLEGISPINRDAVIPLFVERSNRKKGVGIRASALMLDFAFRQLGLQRVTSYYRADNIGTRDLTTKAGFEIEGKMRRSWFADGTFHDTIVVAILKDEWLARRSVLAEKLSSETVVAFGSAGWTWPPQDPAHG